MKDSILVLSGGMDSTTLLHDKKDSIALAVTFLYGSNHNEKEAQCAALNCEMLGIEHILIPLQFMSDYFKSSLLEGAAAIPEGNYDEDNMKSTVVPFRNGIMLAIACGLAESRGLKHVMLANHSGDHAIYPDCRPDFVDAMSLAMKQGTYDGITIDAPYTNLTKAQIASIGKKIGMDYSLTYSCYKGGDKHCGKCGTCRERREAMKLAGIVDPTIYE
ncbi:MAG: 7-cyano-7-deazaguanine synthase QueC [Prevotella sp.]|nr:7-cyano-7-deazaguanine synthase QueC [Bacteroides sp.]MCM1366312.1 7-cyano-7-deazaguanine synthase QueC [Prevotella sp.]MCM1437116.1 7-cyano-7-deazaguanine synthase QueC [Prevotella sp.]